MQYTLNPDGTVTIHHPVRFNDLVMYEFQAITESIADIDVNDEPERYEMVDAVSNRSAIVKRAGSRQTYEVFLTLGAVEEFAKEVAYYIEHNIGCRSELMRGDTADRAYITKVINGCKSALASANKVLTTAGMKAITDWKDEAFILALAEHRATRHGETA